MCYAIIKVKYKKNTDTASLKEIKTKDELAKELVQQERMGTVESITVFLNHHCHKLTEAWSDELYQEPKTELPSAPLAPEGLVA